MAERAGDPVALARIQANAGILAVLGDGAQPASGGVGPWSPDGYVMRTHPDVGEAMGKAAREDVVLVFGIATLVSPAGVIYAVGQGTGGVWVRAADELEHAGALARPGVERAGLHPWLAVSAWRDDLSTWLHAARAGADRGLADA